MMKLLLDTADTDLWQRLAPQGVFSGITTNPLLMQRAKMTCSIDNYARLYEQAQALGYGEIHFQVFGSDWTACAEQILSIGSGVFVKIPAVASGLSVANRLNCPDRVTLTAIYSPSQVMAAESLGVAYAAPYYARLHEKSGDADPAFLAMRQIEQTTRVLVASLRSTEQIEHLAQMGFRTFAIPGSLALEWTENPLSLQAVSEFEAAAG